MLIDTHCHLDFPEFVTDLDSVLRRAQESGVAQVINIGSSIKGSRGSLYLAGVFENVFATVGIHPHEADRVTEHDLAEIKSCAAAKKVVAIGEIGLDYYKNYSRADNQRQLFKSLLALAKELDFPVILHCRDAQDDLLEIIKPFLPLRAVVHCFSGDELFMTRCLEMGFLISFTCNITYKKADKLREMVRLVPLRRLMLETDAPYLSPEGSRGRRNEPYQVRLLAEETSRIKNVTFEEIAQATTLNAKEFFKLP